MSAGGRAVWSLVLVAVTAQARAAAPPPLLRDRHGDPLPPGVIARLGTVRFRGEFQHRLIASPGGTVLAPRFVSELAGPLRLPAGTPLPFLRKGDGVDELVAFAPDDRLVALKGEVGVTVWDVERGKCLWRTPLAPEHYACGVWFADRATLLSVGLDSTARRWDAATGRLLHIRRLPAQAGSSLSALSADGKVLAAVDDDTIGLWSLDTGRALGTVKTGIGLVSWVRFCDGGGVVAAGDTEGQSVVCYWIATGQRSLVRFPGQTFGDLSGDGKVLATVGNKDSIVRLWQTSTARLLGALGKADGRLSFSPDGKWLAGITGDYRISIWSVGPRKRLHVFRLTVNSGAICGFTFSADSRTLFAGDGPRLRVWDVQTGRERLEPEGHEDEVGGLSFSADGRLLATGGLDGAIRVWESGTGKLLKRLPGHRGFAHPLVLSPDGHTLASFGDDCQVRMWDVRTGRERWRFEQFRGLVDNGIVGCTLRLSHDGKLLATETPFGARTKGIQLRQASTGKVQAVIPGSESDPFAFSPAGPVLAIGDFGARLIKLWDVTGSRSSRLTSLKMADLRLRKGNLVFSPDGHCLAVFDEQTIEVWDLATLRRACVRKLPRPVDTVTFTTQGELLALGGSTLENHVDVWDALSGKRLQRITLPDVCFRAWAFSPDGRLLAGARSRLGTDVLVWQLRRAGESWCHRDRVGARQLEALWGDLGDPDPRKGLHAVRSLRDAPADAVSFLRRRLRPAPADRYPHLIAGLGSDRLAVRQAAEGELARLGLRAEHALRVALKDGPDLEVALRLRALLDRFSRPPLPAEALRQLRAVQVLEQVGSGEARELLDRLARGAAEARLSRDARAALRRLAPIE